MWIGDCAKDEISLMDETANGFKVARARWCSGCDHGSGIKRLLLRLEDQEKCERLRCRNAMPAATKSAAA